MSELDGRSWHPVVNKPQVYWDKPAVWRRLRGGPPSLRVGSLLVYDGDVELGDGDLDREVELVAQLAVRQAGALGWHGAVVFELWRVPEFCSWRVNVWHPELPLTERGMVVVPLWDRGPGGGGA